MGGSGRTVLASHSLLPTSDLSRPRDLAFRGGHGVELPCGSPCGHGVEAVWKRLALRLEFWHFRFGIVIIHFAFPIWHFPFWQSPQPFYIFPVATEWKRLALRLGYVSA